jgi:hypothetical protein
MQRMTSEQARREWRELLDQTYARGGEVVIERYGKPIATLVNYEAWEVWKRQRRAFLDAQSAEIEAGNYLTHEQIVADLRTLGRID